MLKVAIAGRPNVGKSTLFNRLTGTQFALVDDQPGVTRDRREGLGHIGPLEFTLFDTAGLEEAEDTSLQARMTEQTLRGVREADVILFLIDGRAGITPIDKHFAQHLRKEGAKIVLVVNKAEGKAADTTLLEAYSFGFGEPVAISAAHNEGMGELYEALAPFASVPEETEEDNEEAPDGILQLAIVGRPNAGKSTLINRLLGEDRLLTGPEAGITRDAIAVPFAYKGREIRLVDTAGMRRRTHIDSAVEKMAVADSLRAIQYAQVVVLVVDAAQPLEKQDVTIASLVEQEGRALVLAVNKWDQVSDVKAVRQHIQDKLQTALPHLRGLPVVELSGLKGSGLDALMRAAFHAYDIWNTHIGTAPLNRWLEDALSRHSPPLIDGRRLKLRYITQAKTRPPTFTLFSNLSDVPEHYLRYLTNDLREYFNLPGVPLRMKIRKSKNPYAPEKK